MAKRSIATAAVPSSTSKHLALLGERLRIARKRRRMSMAAWAAQMQVSEPTVARMERGDPKVQIGIYASALALIGRVSALPELAAPECDLDALALDVEAAATRVIRSAPVRRRPRLRANGAYVAAEDLSQVYDEC